MKRRIRIPLAVGAFIVIGMCCLLTACRPKGLPGQFSDRLATPLYDCTLTVKPHRGLAHNSAVNIALEWASWDAYTSVKITPGQLIVQSHGRKPHTWRVPMHLPSGQRRQIAILRRGQWLGVINGERLVFYQQVPKPKGGYAGVIADKGWSVNNTSAQVLEPVFFSDNFMRTEKDAGGWHIKDGKWALRSAWDDDPHGGEGSFANTSYSQNPFAWRGSNPKGVALCTVGEPNWEDYTVSAAVQPAPGSAVGLMVNRDGAGNGFLVRWTAANDQSKTGKRLAVYRVNRHERTLLASDPGGYLPGHWYKIAANSTVEGISVSVDGVERLFIKDPLHRKGSVGLYAEGPRGAVFDDVTVYGHTVDMDIVQESQQRRLGQNIRDDKEMRKWAYDWEPLPGWPNVQINRRELYGDQRMTLWFTTRRNVSGEVALLLNGDGFNPDMGYRAVLRRTGNKSTATVYHDQRQLASGAGPDMEDEMDYTLSFRHDGDRLLFQVDGETVLDCDDGGKVAGRKPAYRLDGYFATITDAVAIGRNVLDYLFTDAPVDWAGDGTWASTVRWACDARWSFLSGWSHGDAALWHKNRFHGDQSLETFLAVKMEYPDARTMYADRYCGMGIAICGDGHNPRSGYSAVFGAPDEMGRPNRRTILMRNGKIVSSAKLFLPQKDDVHKTWSHMRLTKNGPIVELAIEGRPVIKYTDPQPLDAGIPAIWTTNNGLSVARARIYYANPPEPRTDTQLGLDYPKTDEWQNIGTTLRLDFPNACSSSGHAVSLRVAPLGVPVGEERPRIEGKHVTFTPEKVGVHWYEVTAYDGKTESPGYHLLMPVFDPTLGRDDSRALVLYRFDEGRGTTVQDYGMAPLLPLKITQPEHVRWKPDQGLTTLTGTLIASKGAARKLENIARTRECTLEAWLSYATLYPGIDWEHWAGCVWSWEKGDNQRNIAFGYHSFTLILAARSDADVQQFNGKTAEAPYNHIGLQHQVITWDGRLTRFYVNGRLVGEVNYQWMPETWTPDAPLYLGRQPGKTRPFLGTYYLLALHDKALTSDQVLRHYEAGPSAR